ncbi:Bug family tripartite tricarboxylate transporter substrate binding protein [Goodfellowiella coeruleoviolacea]|nr:tripartite tricarboxylate transporter substrate binding protein [Goodfellowiella coeruleoviolacea]
MQKDLQDTKIASGVQVFNVEGASGTNGLKQLADSKDDNLLMTMGLIMVGGIQTTGSEKTLKDTTPIARLLAESEVLVVPAESPWTTLEGFLESWRQDPKNTPIAGGGAGGSEQILLGLIADQVGIDPGQINYVANSGGGKALEKVLSGEVKAGLNGVSEFKEQIDAGKLRALAVSGDNRSKLLPEVKTLKEQGVGLSFYNWRGVHARPGLSDSDKQKFTDMLTRLHDSEAWKKTLVDNDWEDYFLTGAEYSSFVDSENERARKVLTDIGLVK